MFRLSPYNFLVEKTARCANHSILTNSAPLSRLLEGSLRSSSPKHDYGQAADTAEQSLQYDKSVAWVCWTADSRKLHQQLHQR
jgi:hypothetical protein